MRWRQVRRVARRHLKEMVRERRTIIFLAFSPIMFVLLFTVARDELTNQIGNQQRLPHTVAVTGGSHAPALVSFMKSNRLKVLAVTNAVSTVRDKHAPVGIEVPKDFEQALAAGRQPKIRVFIAERSVRNQFAESHVIETLQAYGELTTRARLRARGIPESVAHPIVVVPEDLTSQRERSGGALADFLPFFLASQVIGLMTGIASDVTVGEKERRTVEALLATPLRRREVAAGKWLVTVVMGIGIGLITLISGVLAFRLSTSAAIAGGATLPSGAISKAVLGLIALTFVLGSLQILIGFFARSAQQAGMFMTPLFLVTFLPILLFQTVSGSTVGGATYAIPGLGPLLLIRYGLAGTATATAPIVVIVSSLLYAGVALSVADRVFRSERAIQRASG